MGGIADYSGSLVLQVNFSLFSLTAYYRFLPSVLNKMLEDSISFISYLSHDIEKNVYWFNKNTCTKNLWSFFGTENGMLRVIEFWKIYCNLFQKSLENQKLSLEYFLLCKFMGVFVRKLWVNSAEFSMDLFS